MRRARLISGLSAAVTAANDLTIGNGNKVPLDGNGTINGIRVLNWGGGSEVDFICSGSPTFKHNTAPSAGFARLQLQGGADVIGSPGMTLSLWYDGTDWQQKAIKYAALKTGVYVSRGSVTLVAGVGTVADANVTANTIVRYWVYTPGGTQGFLSYANNAGVGFAINSTSATETSVVQYEIVSY